MEPDGSNVTRLTSTHEDTTPAWSPDGSRIAFKSHRDFNDEIYVMDADGDESVEAHGHMLCAATRCPKTGIRTES